MCVYVCINVYVWMYICIVRGAHPPAFAGLSISLALTETAFGPAGWADWGESWLVVVETERQSRGRPCDSETEEVGLGPGRSSSGPRPIVHFGLCLSARYL